MSYHGLGLSIGPSLPGGITPGQIASTPPPQTANPDTSSFMSFTPAPAPAPTSTPGAISRLVGTSMQSIASLLAPKSAPPASSPAPTPDQTTPTPDQTASDFTQQLTPPPSTFPWKTVAAVGAGALVLGVGGWFLLRKKKDVTPNSRRGRRRVSSSQDLVTYKWCVEKKIGNDWRFFSAAPTKFEAESIRLAESAKSSTPLRVVKMTPVKQLERVRR